MLPSESSQMPGKDPAIPYVKMDEVPDWQLILRSDEEQLKCTTK
jgi:hypothetical protein